MEYFVKDNGKNRVVYRSLLIDDPRSFSVLANKTAMKLLKEISERPACAMDLARRLNIHQQKVYYNLHRLQDAGLIKLLRKEERTGGTAKIYSIKSPVVSIKLADEALMTTDRKTSFKNPGFLRPFVKEGKLNARVILGDSYSHGKYDVAATEGPHSFDFALLLGSYLNDLNYPNYMLDTEVSEEDLEDNLILFGNAKSNTIIEKINSELPVYFDPESGYLISKSSSKTFEDPRTGVILKWPNPFNKNKMFLLFGGVRTRGVKAAILAFTRNMDEVIKTERDDGKLVRIVEGYDKKGNKVIDSIKFLE